MACYFLGPVGWNRRERDAMVPSADWRYSSDGSAKPGAPAIPGAYFLFPDHHLAEQCLYIVVRIDTHLTVALLV